MIKILLDSHLLRRSSPRRSTLCPNHSPVFPSRQGFSAFSPDAMAASSGAGTLFLKKYSFFCKKVLTKPVSSGIMIKRFELRPGC